MLVHNIQVLFGHRDHGEGGIGAMRTVAMKDPLLGFAAVLLLVALGGILLGLFWSVIGLLVSMVSHPPLAFAWSDPALRRILGAVLGIAVLATIAGGIGNVIAIIASVARGDAFAASNVRHIEGVALRILGVEALGLAGRWLDVRIGGTVNGFQIGADAGIGNAVVFALLLFVLARVFRQGQALQRDVEGTV